MHCTVNARMTLALVATLVGVSASDSAAQRPPVRDSAKLRPSPSRTDSAFHALQQRGRVAMGVDQYTSIHRFDDLHDGGRIELQRDVDDETGARAIRAHLRAIKSAFEAGDFSTPAFVHMRSVPGAAVMATRRVHIRYDVRDLPRGAELRIRTKDAAAVAAVHQFMAFQRGDHRAGGAQAGKHP